MSTNPTSFVKGIFKKDNLLRAGGFVAGSMFTHFVLSRFAAKLPGANAVAGGLPIGRLGYGVAIPALGAFAALKMRQPRLAEGMLASGLAVAISELVNRYTPLPQMLNAAPVNAVKEYFDANAPLQLPAPVAGVNDAYSSDPAFSEANAF